ncbi:hypothetical protein [Paenibacillus sp. MMO-58]|uniref:hypothetical protein n=1 Tax=Paenibacillus sp. MMO-58 TaxID=3081290 RepID=UPI0030185C6E
MNDGLIGGALEKVNPYYYLGGVVGCIAGYAMAKIYLIWAMMFIDGGYDRFTSDAWNPGSTPLWYTATRHTGAFTFWVTVLFIVIGILFVKLCRVAYDRNAALASRKNKEKIQTHEYGQ